MAFQYIRVNKMSENENRTKRIHKSQIAVETAVDDIKNTVNAVETDISMVSQLRAKYRRMENQRKKADAS
jgi:hypothetical protein